MKSIFNIHGIDMRDEFSILEKAFSLKVLLIRNNTNTRCKCYSPLHQCGKDDCIICGGTGLISTIQQIPVIYQPYSREPLDFAVTKIGDTARDDITFFINRMCAPQADDVILIVGYDEKGIPIDVKHTCDINAVNNFRGDFGRTEFYKVHASYNPGRVKQDDKRLKKISIKSKKRLVEGGIYTWIKK